MYFAYLVKQNQISMKRSFIVLFLILISIPTFAQKPSSTPKTSFTKMYLPVWLEAKEHCLAVANAMPVELYA